MASEVLLDPGLTDLVWLIAVGVSFLVILGIYNVMKTKKMKEDQ